MFTLYSPFGLSTVLNRSIYFKLFSYSCVLTEKTKREFLLRETREEGGREEKEEEEGRKTKS